MRIVQPLRRLRKKIQRNKISRFLVLLIVSTAIALFFLRPALTQQPVTVSVLIQAGEASQWQPLIAEFEQENPDIRIKTIEGPNATDAVEDLYTSSFLLGNSPYDLVYMDVIWVPKFAAAGWLLNLSDRTSEAELAAFLDGDVRAGMYQKKPVPDAFSFRCWDALLSHRFVNPRRIRTADNF